MNIRWGRRFKKDIRKLSPKVFGAYLERIEIFARYPFDPILDNHPLKGVWRGYHSINITGDWRLIYEQLDADTNRLTRIGTHHQLFGS